MTADEIERQIAELTRKAKEIGELYAMASLVLAAYRLALIALGADRERN